MLTLHYNGYDVPTGKDFSVRFSWKNPACFFNEIPGSAGLGIDIPVNDYSKAIFGSPHRFEKFGTGSDRKFAGVDIRFNGVLLMSGTLNITNATSETYSAWLQSSVGTVGEEQREKFINEMLLPGETEAWSDFKQQTFDNKGTFDEDDDDYCTGEFINRRFWEEIGKEITDEEEYINDEGEPDTREITITRLTGQFRDNFGYKVNKTGSGIAITTGDGCVVSAFLFLKFLLREVLKRCQFFIDPENNAFEDELTDYANLAFYNNYNLLIPTFSTEQKDIFEDDPVTGLPIAVRVDEITSMTWQLDYFNYVRLIPHINVGSLILGLQNLLNIAFQFRNDSRVNIIDRESIITMEPFDLDKYFLGEWIIGERKDLSLKFITEYDKDDSVIGDNFHDLSERRFDFGTDVALKSDLENLSPVYGEIRRVMTSDQFFEYKWDEGATYNKLNIASEFDKVGWVFASTGPQPQFSGLGDEIEEIRTVVSTPYNNGADVVTVMQKGVISYTRTLWNNFSPRLVFHNGTNSVLTTDTVSLQWAGPTGLLEKRWKNWAAFWRNRLPVEGEFDLPMNLIYYLVNNITGKFKTNNGDFIIEEMEVEFGMNMIGRTRIKGYKL
jgi:hypothetical protein